MGKGEPLVVPENSVQLTRDQQLAIGLLFIRMLCDCFKARRQLEAEILVLRHQLNVLRQRAPRRLHLRWTDRALFIWLYRRCPRILDAISPQPCGSDNSLR